MAAREDPSLSVREAATWAVSHIEGPKVDGARLADSPPVPLAITKPTYPEAAFKAKVQGTEVALERYR